MQKKYNHQSIELIVQQYWKEKKTFQVYEDINKKKYYCLAMIPYPSGKLHMGHVRNYTISDIISRYQRMKGKNVLQPIGWDAFGLPAEEAALKHNVLPSNWTNENIKYMKNQLKKLGLSYDWNREINTSDPKYYKWEQWFFNQLYLKNMIYRKKSIVNWCPKDKTVLANEQVINGNCWRCQTRIKIKIIPQWFIRITKYANKLLKDLKLLKNWPEKVLSMQKNWIGKSHGFEIILNLKNIEKKIKIYTTQLHLLMDVTYISISPLHHLSKRELTKKQINKFIQNLYTINNNKNQKIYLGKKLSIFAIHPITKQNIPIWVTNYTELEYNTRIKLSIPKYNKCDFEFSKKYNINLKNVLIEDNQIDQIKQNHDKQFQYYEFYKLNKTNKKKFVFEYLSKKKIINKKNKFKIQDWSISRQRYWGTPIPIAYDQKNQIHLIPNHQLPVLLPHLSTIHDLKNINKIYQNWSNIKINNQMLIREKDTFDTFMESSWYYIRYTNPHDDQKMVNIKSSNYWLPIDQYIGGIEHATMHLIYFRFFHKLLYDMKLVNCVEPAVKLLCQGMVLSDAFYYINHDNKKKWVNINDLKISNNKEENKNKIYYFKDKIVTHAGMIKMSKSKNNGVDPEIMIKKYGADTIRLFIIFSAPVISDIEWNESGVKGMYRFLQKVWNLVYNFIYNVNINNKNQAVYEKYDLQCYLHKTILKVSHDIQERQSFNTAISEIIKLTNLIYKINIQKYYEKEFIKEILNNIIKMLYPFAPHISFILWNKLKNNTIIDYESWPKYNEKYTKINIITLIIQINGKTKDIMEIQSTCNQSEIINYVKKRKKVLNAIKNQKIKKIIYIPNKVINLII